MGRNIMGVCLSVLTILVFLSPLIQAQGGEMTVAIYSPTDGMTTSESSIEVSGVVYGYSGSASELRVTVSSPVSTLQASVDEYGMFLTTIDLKDGTNLITVEATDAFGNTASASIVVIKTTVQESTPPFPQYRLNIPENVSVEALLEFTGTGRCKLVLKGSGQNPFLNKWTQTPASSTPGSVGWDVTITARSMELGKLRLTASGWVMVPLSQEQKQMVSAAIFAYKLSPQTYNQQIIQELESKLNVDVTSLNVSQLDFDSGASKLTFSIEAEIQSSKINASVMEELPLSITTNGSGSFPAGFESFTEATSFNAFLKAATTSASVVIQMNISGSSIQASLASEFPLRSDPMGLVTRSDNEVIINFGALKNYPSTFSLTASDKANVVLTVKAPPNAQAQGLPSGYETLDGAWVWRGQNAVSAISSLLRGDSNTVISYPISPATVIIQNIQEKVGQTIAVENNYIKNVVVESANTVAINFEKTHEIKKVRVSFASLAQAPQVTVQVLPEKPPEIQHPSDKKVHYYFTLEKPTSAGITTASIEFKVSKIWITAQDVDSNTIKLLRYSNGWQELKTEKSGEDENYLYWTAELPGFSIFAVVALPTQATGQLPSLYIVIGAVVVVVIVLLAVIWKHTSRVPKE